MSEEKEEKKVEVVNKEQSNIGFWKKIYYSIFKISKYEEMKEEGLKKAIKYLLKLILLTSAVMALVSTYETNDNINELSNYLDSNLPEITLKNNELTLDNNEAVILDNEETIKLFGYTIIINPLLEEAELINEYSSLYENSNCIIFSKDQAIFVQKGYIVQNIEDNIEENKESQENVDAKPTIQKKQYKELLAQYNISEDEEIKKQDFISFYENIPLSYYWIEYFIVYFIMNLIIFVLEILVVALMGILETKLLKLKTKNQKDILTLSIYAFTLSFVLQVIYSIINYFVGFKTEIFQTVIILIAFAYIAVIIYKMKKVEKEKI